MRVLIIGGTGIISTGITRLLVERGDEVVLYNRGQRTSQVEGGYEVIIGDRKDFDTFEQQMAAVGHFDCVIDMFCFAPTELESAIRAFKGRTDQYVFCSTVDVYTKPATKYPITEDAERQPSPDFAYAFNKARCEQILFRAHEAGELAVTSIRPGHTYGEGGNNLIHSLHSGNYYLDRMRRGLPIVVHGDGTSFWPTCHRDDVAGAFVGALGNNRALGRGYHVAGEEWMTWEGYYQGLAEAIGAPAPELVRIPTDFLVRMAPEKAAWTDWNFKYNNLFDNRAACEDLGFRVVISWVEGARRTIDWLAANDLLQSCADYPFYDRIIEAWRATGDRLEREFKG